MAKGVGRLWEPNTFLSCGHGLMLYVPPEKNERLWCFACDVYKWVIATHGCWYSTCLRCYDSRVYGKDAIAAEAWAMQHVGYKSHSRHIVQVQVLSLKGDRDPSAFWVYGSAGETGRADSIDDARAGLAALVTKQKRRSKSEALATL